MFRYELLLLGLSDHLPPMKKLRHLPLLSNFYGQPQQLLNKILCPPNGDLGRWWNETSNWPRRTY